MKRLYAALVLVAAFAIVEFIGAYLSGSLSLGVDAVHMVVDTGGMTIAVITARIASRLTDLRDKRRVESHGAHLNMNVLLVTALGIVIVALWRFFHPVSIESVVMFYIAGIGLSINGLILILLHFGRGENLNLKAAHFHVVADTLTSVGVVIAAVFITLTGYVWIDPATSIFIGVVIFQGARHIRRESKKYLESHSG